MAMGAGWYALAQPAASGVGPGPVPCAYVDCTVANMNFSGADVPSNGWYLSGANTLSGATNGVLKVSITSGGSIINAANGSGFSLSSGAASGTAPTLVPRSSAGTSGIGSQASGNISAIASGVEIERYTSTGPVLVTIPTDAATTDATLCRVTATGVVATGTGTLGICLGTSSARFKRDIRPMTESAIDKIGALTPSSYRYNDPRIGDGGKKTDYWLIAEATAKVLPECVPTDNAGRPQTVDPICVQAFMLKAMKEQQVQISTLRQQLSQLKRSGHM